MNENNQDVARELKELRQNKETTTKVLKQLHDKADWLNRCINIKLNYQIRMEPSEGKANPIAIANKLKWSVSRLLNARDSSRKSDMALRKKKIELEQEKIELEQEKVELERKLENLEIEKQGLEMLLREHSITIPTIAVWKIPTDDSSDSEED